MMLLGQSRSEMEAMQFLVWLAGFLFTCGLAWFIIQSAVAHGVGRALRRHAKENRPRPAAPPQAGGQAFSVVDDTRAGR